MWSHGHPSAVTLHYRHSWTHGSRSIRSLSQNELLFYIIYCRIKAVFVSLLMLFILFTFKTCLEYTHIFSNNKMGCVETTWCSDSLGLQCLSGWVSDYMLCLGRAGVIPLNPQHVMKVMKSKGEAGNASSFSLSKPEPPFCSQS